MLEMRLITRTEVQAVTRCVGNIGSNMEGKCFTEDLCYRDLYKCSPKKFSKNLSKIIFRQKNYLSIKNLMKKSMVKKTLG